MGEVTGEEPPTIILPDIKLRTLTTFLTEFYLNSVSDVNTEMTRLLGFKLFNVCVYFDALKLSS